MVMTPFKLRPRFPSNNRSRSRSSLSDSTAEFDDEPMVSSPPRGGTLFMSDASDSNNNSNKEQLPSANLFGGDAVPSTTTKKLQRRRVASRKDNKQTFPLVTSEATARTAAGAAATTAATATAATAATAGSPHQYASSSSSSSSTILRSLDLNAEATSPPSSSRQRKRTSDTATNVPAGREHVAYEDSDEDMFSSPVNQQQQQQQQQQQHKASPHYYRTLDGRTVMSKNPFSPFTPMDATATADDAFSPHMGTAPAMPDSFYPSSSTAARPSATTESPMIALARRSPSIQAKQKYFQPTSSGFPDQQGRYSFTGSPIEEVDASLFIDHAAAQHAQYGNHYNNNNNNKIRRLQEANDVATRPKLNPLKITMEGNEESSLSGLKQKNPYRWQHSGGNDNISPSDVMSFFPAAPPTPVKRERGGASFTPLRIRQAPSTPPARRYDGHDDLFVPSSDSSSSAAQQQSIPESRFSTDFDVIGQLGNGSFGTVYKCLSRLDGCMYAVKAAKRKAKGQADRDRMLKEVYALAALSDQADTAAFHIVRYHQAWMEENRLYIQTELCSCTLQNEIQRGTLENTLRRFKLLRELSVALEFIHRHGMVHLDIKPENIFVKNDQFKLGDFGLVSKSVTPSGDDVEEGDSRYMSMELLSGEFKDLTKSDIFSMGATMYEICLGRELPADGQEWQDIRSGSLQPLSNPNTPFAMELIIKEMMHPDEAMRPPPSQLLKKNELLSDEQKQLLAEKQKVFRVNMALALQTERMKKLTPPRPGGLMRANTWNGSLPKWL